MPRRQYQQPDSPEEQQLSRLLQLAQFANVASEPEIAQRRLEQQDQENRVSAAIHLLGLQQQKNVAEQTAKNEDMQRVLQEKQIDELAKGREATIKGNVADALLTMGTHNPDILPLVVGALDKLGFPQVAGSASDLHKTNVEQKIAQHLQIYNAIKDKSSYLTAIKADPSMTPEVWSGLQARLPKNIEPTAPKSSLGTKLGSTTRTLMGLDPLNLASSVGQAIYDSGKKNAPDFWDALLNKKPQPTTQ